MIKEDKSERKYKRLYHTQLIKCRKLKEANTKLRNAQQAIKEFGYWMVNNRFTMMSNPDNDDLHFYRYGKDDSDPLTIDQAYELFLEDPRSREEIILQQREELKEIIKDRNGNK